MLKRLWLVLCPLSFVLCPSPARAIDAEVSKPYQLQVVVRLAPNRLLTDVFKDKLRRELRDSLQAAFGPLVQVEVVDRHPKLKEIEASGLQRVLDRWFEVSDLKTHFVLVDFIDGQYEIEAGQHDGPTGLSSPVVRRVRTGDREFVARTAAILIDQDFGLVGTVVPETKQTVRVAFKGSALIKDNPLGITMARWAKKDDVFAIANAPARGNPRVEQALLQVMEEPQGGSVRCQLYQRHPDSLGDAPAHRCIKLGTTTAPLRIRLQNRKGVPQANLQVRVSPYGLEPKDVKEQGLTNADGFFQTKSSYQNIAFVLVYTAGDIRARFPAEILEGRTYVCPIEVDEKADVAGQFNLRVRRWLGQLAEAQLVQANVRRKLNELMTKNDLKGAEKESQEGLKQLDADITAAARELAGLRGAERELPKGVPFKRDELARGEKRLEEFQESRTELEKFIKELEETAKLEPERKKARALVDRARLAEGQADFDEALSLYDEAVAQYEQIEGKDKVPQVVVKRRDDLKKSWTIPEGDEAHRKAREFVYQRWAKLASVQEINDALDEAHRSVQVLREKEDKLTLRKLLQVADVSMTAKLQQELNSLRPRESEDDRRRAETIGKVADNLEKLLTEVNKYLGPPPKAKPGEK
jgi:tetratricopeptide (TPR) repeat protein